MFGNCPKQWCLKRAKYLNLSDWGYPVCPNMQTIKGNVVHKVISEFENEYCSVGGPLKDFFRSFGLIRRVALEIERQVDGEIQSNPRVLSRNAINPSLEECASQIKRTVLALPEVAQRSGSFGQGRRNKGANVKVQIPDPNVVSYLDFYDGNRLVEFKSGARNEEHVSQVRFYAAVIYSYYGSPPEVLQIAYAGLGETVSIDKLDATDCERILDEVRGDIRKNEEFIYTGRYEARVGDGCRFCDVRHLCKSYWDSKTGLFQADERYVADMEVTLTRRLRQSSSGAAYEFIEGASNVGILASNRKEPIPDGALVRILRGRVNWSRGRLVISLRDDSELFLLEDPEL